MSNIPTRTFSSKLYSNAHGLNHKREEPSVSIPQLTPFLYTPFTKIFDITGVGLEYEIELALFLDSPIPVSANVYLVNSISHLVRENKAGLVLDIDPELSWVLLRDSDTQVTLQFSKQALFQALYKNHYAHGQFSKAEEVVDMSVFNFEIRTSVFSRVEGAVEQANYNLGSLIATLKSLNIPRFALLTSGVRCSNPRTINCTKHLNLSLTVSKVYQELIRDKKVRAVYQWFSYHYPQYFRVHEVILQYFRVQEVILNEHSSESYLSSQPSFSTIGVKHEPKERIHIKLPYSFLDYKRLFESTAKLPDLKQVYNYQHTVAVQANHDLSPATDLDIENYGLTLLGFLSENKKHWYRKSDLV